MSTRYSTVMRAVTLPSRPWGDVGEHFTCDEADAVEAMLRLHDGDVADEFIESHIASDVKGDRHFEDRIRDDWTVTLAWGDGTDADTPTSVLGKWHADFHTAQAVIWGRLVHCDMEWWTIEQVDPENLKPLALVTVLAADIEKVVIT